MKNKINLIWVILATIVFALFIGFVLPRASEYSNEMIGDYDSPDSSFTYSSQDLYNMAKDYGESGRKEYIKLRWTFDVVWPIAYTLFLAAWILKLTEYTPVNKFSKYIVTLPIVAMGFDYLENIGATIVMWRYPLTSGVIASLTPIMTTIKWIILSGSFIVLILLINLIIFTRLRDSMK